MGCGSCCFGCVIVLMNTLFGILALLFIAIGSLLHFLSDIAKTYFQGMLDSMSKTFSGFGLTMEDIFKGDQTLSIIDILKQIAIPFIVIGVILFVICILGCCSVYCSSKTLLIAYMCVLGVIVTAQTLAVIILYVKMPEFRNTAVESLKNSINSDYEGRTGTGSNETTNFFTTVVDLVQSQVGCCGIDNYTNFETATKWQAKKQSIEKIPATCCIFENNIPKNAVKCAAADDPTFANIDTPCFNLVDNLFGDAKTMTICAVAAIIGLQALILMLAICYCQSLSSKIGPV